MSNIESLIKELAKSIDLYKWSEMQSSYYTLDRISNLVKEILQQNPDQKIRKKVMKMEKEAYAYYPPMTKLEAECRAASSAWRNPLSSHVIY